MIELWHFRYSHFNEKVRWALDHKGIAHVRHTLIPGFHVPTTLRLTGKPLTPVVSFDGEVVGDSTAIIAELEQRFAAAPLYPADDAERAQALAIEDWFDEEAGADVRRLFYDAFMKAGGKALAHMSCAGFGRGKYVAFRAASPLLHPVIRWNMGLGRDAVAEAVRRLPMFFDKIEQELSPAGYLVGDRFSVADLTACALLGPILLPPQLGEALIDDPPERLLELRNSVASRDGFQWALSIFERHRRQDN